MADENEATRAIRRPAEPQAAPLGAPRSEDRAEGPGGAPGKGSGRDDTVPRVRSKVYGKPRSGSAPVRPIEGSGRTPGGPEDAPHRDGGGPDSREATARGGGSGSGFGGFGGGRGGGPGGSGGRRGPRVTGRTVVRIVVVLVVLLLVAAVAGYFMISARLHSVEAMTDYDKRAAETPGEDWLLVGSDSRAGLTAAQRRKLATGKAVGKRTDTMMLLHIPSDGRPTLVSLPRDSYVPIEGHGSGKLNAAYAYGGPKLLTKTVERVTGIRIDHYMEIGFGGFVGIVDAIGGVNICVKQNIDDHKAGINLKKGCQDMDGGTALGYVRTRKTGAIPDFDRTQRQREFFSAVVQKAASPGTLLNPFTSVPLALSAADSVAVDPGTGLFDLLSVGLAMRGGPVTTAVPIGSLPTIGGQAVVKWDTQKALRLFEALAADKQVPKDVITK
ncbi:LCP family protein [Microbispora sp. NBC_01389]|uniref:LCP family protein n=1 Tax=Microbispora sp. NBC_01389 TaxID=2903584 RepID=UPI0032535046